MVLALYCLDTTGAQVRADWSASSSLLHTCTRLRLRRGGLPRKEQPEHLTEDQFFRQQRHRQRKDHPPDNCDECDCHLHDVLPDERQCQGRDKAKSYLVEIKAVNFSEVGFTVPHWLQ